MSSSDGGEQQQHDEHHVAVVAALQRARDAVAALVAEPASKFLEGMRSALQQAEAALQQQPRGRWAWTLPLKANYLTSLADSHPRRPAREEAYAAMANLKAVGFAAASSTDRSRKSTINKRQKTSVDEAAAAAARADHEPMPDANAPGACRVPFSPRPAHDARAHHVFSLVSLFCAGRSARPAGSSLAMVRAANQGGVSMDVDEMLADADEAQRQLEAEAIEMNAEMNPGDAQVTLLADPRIP